jgi:hypothetical protein
MFMTACGEDEYVYPDLVTEFSCLTTDAKGYGTQIVTDEGKVWHLQEGNRPNKLTPDSTYRVVSRFAPIDDTYATAYSFWKAISPIPQQENMYETIHTDPVSIQSIWKSGNYLNLILQIKVKDKQHELSFVENGITTNEDGSQTLTLTLFHDRKDDVEGFDEKHYLSVPLWHYQDQLNQGDQIVINLNTYKEGMTSRTYIY